MKNIIKDTSVLFLITLVAGLLLGGIYEITKEPIERQKELKTIQAYQDVFEDAVSFEALELAMPEEQNWSDTINSTNKAMDGNGNLLGYVIDITTHEGYNGDIQFTIGIRMDGTINGKKDVVYPQRASVCLETQHYPDTPNKPHWPSAILKPGDTYRSQCIYKFGVEK